MNEQIENAVNQFRQLLVEQINLLSAEHEKRRDETVIGLVSGDGIGPKISEMTEEVLNELLAKEISSGKVMIRKIDGLTIENRLACKKAIPDDVLDEIKKCDILLKGPTETPKGGTLESANVALRRELDLYACVRPVKVEAEGIDWTFFRENTEGEYALGSRGIQIDDSLAIDFKVTTRMRTERIARKAFEFAKNNGKKSVTVVTKANIMKKTDGMFSEICHEVAKEYPDITVMERYIDIMTAELINTDVRNNFEVFVLPNLYGDIITDEAAQIQGGVGTAGSANIGDRYAMFEAIHGTAPRLIADGLIEFANPESLMRAAQMMLEHIGLFDKAKTLENAIENAKVNYAVSINDGITGKKFTEAVLEEIRKK